MEELADAQEDLFTAEAKQRLAEDELRAAFLELQPFMQPQAPAVFF